MCHRMGYGFRGRLRSRLRIPIERKRQLMQAQLASRMSVSFRIPPGNYYNEEPRRSCSLLKSNFNGRKFQMRLNYECSARKGTWNQHASAAAWREMLGWRLRGCWGFRAREGRMIGPS